MKTFDKRLALGERKVAIIGVGFVGASIAYALTIRNLAREIAGYINLNTEVVKGFIVGEHGDSQIPIWSRVAIAGVPIAEFCENVGLEWNEEIRAEIAGRVKNMGAEIIADKGRTHYGIATCVCSLADAVFNQRLTIASVTTPLEGEYGVEGVALSVPSIIGVNGVEKRLEERWHDEELEAFLKTADKMRGVSVIK